MVDNLHLPLGEGSIDYEALFRGLRRIEYNRTMTLELRPYEIEHNLDAVTQRLSDAGFALPLSVHSRV